MKNIFLATYKDNQKRLSFHLDVTLERDVEGCQKSKKGQPGEHQRLN